MRGGGWDNAKKIVETILKQKKTALHDATMVGETVGDPFKDTSTQGNIVRDLLVGISC